MLRKIHSGIVKPVYCYYYHCYYYYYYYYYFIFIPLKLISQLYPFSFRLQINIVVDVV